MRPSNNLKNKTPLGSQFLRTTTGIQSEPDAIDESRFIITFLTILVVTEICSSRLVLEGNFTLDSEDLFC